jgi:hypothetical protein
LCGFQFVSAAVLAQAKWPHTSMHKAMAVPNAVPDPDPYVSHRFHAVTDVQGASKPPLRTWHRGRKHALSEDCMAAATLVCRHMALGPATLTTNRTCLSRNGWRASRRADACPQHLTAVFAWPTHAQIGEAEGWEVLGVLPGPLIYLLTTHPGGTRYCKCAW